MIRRDSELPHDFAGEVFRNLDIYDIQGLLREGDRYSCGTEVYQVNDFCNGVFDNLEPGMEMARFYFCKQLSIPYFVIMVSSKTERYRIYRVDLNETKLDYILAQSFGRDGFVSWWRSQQSYCQVKPMYDAAERLKDSIVDKVLSSADLAWGVNIDGFMLERNTPVIKSIIEKRVCKFGYEYSILNYDPNKFFHGTYRRGGDSASWMMLWDLCGKLQVPLFLLTFEKSKRRLIGAAEIDAICPRGGLSYKNDKKPCENIIKNEAQGLFSWIENGYN